MVYQIRKITRDQESTISVIQVSQFRKLSEMKNTYKTYAWQEVRATTTYYFQTSSPKIARRLKRRMDFELIGKAINRELWIFKKTFYNRQKAIQTLKRVTRGSVQYDAVRGEYCVYTYPIMTKKRVPPKSTDHIKNNQRANEVNGGDSK
jgi:hypothetical protein